MPKLLGALLVLLLLSACGGPGDNVPTLTPTSAPTQTPYVITIVVTATPASVAPTATERLLSAQSTAPPTVTAPLLQPTKTPRIIETPTQRPTRTPRPTQTPKPTIIATEVSLLPDPTPTRRPTQTPIPPTKTSLPTPCTRNDGTEAAWLTMVSIIGYIDAEWQKVSIATQEFNYPPEKSIATNLKNIRHWATSFPDDAHHKWGGMKPYSPKWTELTNLYVQASNVPENDPHSMPGYKEQADVIWDELQQTYAQLEQGC